VYPQPTRMRRALRTSRDRLLLQRPVAWNGSHPTLSARRLRRRALSAPGSVQDAAGPCRGAALAFGSAVGGTGQPAALALTLFERRRGWLHYAATIGCGRSRVKGVWRQSVPYAPISEWRHRWGIPGSYCAKNHLRPFGGDNPIPLWTGTLCEPMGNGASATSGVLREVGAGYSWPMNWPGCCRTPPALGPPPCRRTTCVASAAASTT
jgi:hypothetical protein